MLESMFKLLIQSESNRVQSTINFMTAIMEIPAIREIIIHSNDAWVCDTIASNHFAKSKDGAYKLHMNGVIGTDC